jgi:DNA mismatch repair protein MutL
MQPPARPELRVVPRQERPAAPPVEARSAGEAPPPLPDGRGSPAPPPRPADFLPLFDRPESPRVLQLYDAYLVVETEEGMLVIDQHALHERILFEQLTTARTAGRRRSSSAATTWSGSSAGPDTRAWGTTPRHGGRGGFFDGSGRLPGGSQSLSPCRLHQVPSTSSTG